MSFEIKCPNCGLVAEAEEDWAGMEIECPDCSASFILPATGAEVSELKSIPEEDVPHKGKTISSFLREQGVGGGTVRLKKSTFIPKSEKTDKKPSSFFDSDSTKKYNVGKTIAQGGMGAILNAKDLNIHRNVAMKVMLDPEDQPKDNIVRFIEEAQVTGQLEHPCIVPVHELGIDDKEQVFYTMKMVKGINLDDILKGIKDGNKELIENYPLNRLLNIFLKVCEGMAFAHSHNVIHRDLKPENIMIGEYGEVLVMDWGLSKILGQSDNNEEDRDVNIQSLRSKEGDPMMTIEGTIMGTPSFLAPEMAQGKISEVDQRADIYTLGGILYNILTLQPPKDGKAIYEILIKTIEGDIVPPADFNSDEAFPHCPGNNIPAALSSVTMKALALDRDDRYQTVKEMHDDLEAFQSGFATSAEGAGLIRQVWLLFKRHKTEAVLIAVGVAILLGVVLGFLVKVNFEKNRAEKNAKIARNNEKAALKNEKLANQRLVELQATAPVFYRQCLQHIRLQQFDEALKMIDYAISLNPKEGKYYIVRGNILQTLLRLEESVKSYTKALPLEADPKDAKESLAVSEKLLQDYKRPYPVALMNELKQHMLSQDRHSEALTILKLMNASNSDKLKVIQARLKKNPLPALSGMRVQLKEGLIYLEYRGKNPDLRGLESIPFNSVDLSNSAVSDLSALKGMPISSLNLSNCKNLKDLKEIKDLKLKTLNLSSCRSLKTLAPLKNMPLESINLCNCTRLESLTPLRGKKLKYLNLYMRTPNTFLKSLDGLQVSQLESLNAYNCNALHDISALKGMPLKNVNLSSTNITSLKSLAESPLEKLDFQMCKRLRSLDGIQNKGLTLSLYGCTNLESLNGLQGNKLESKGLNFYNYMKLEDISALKGIPLNYINLRNTKVSDMSALKGMKLTSITLAGHKISDISFLKGMQLKTIDLTWAVKLRDISCLKNTASLKKIYLDFTKVTDLSPLKKMQLEEIGLPNKARDIEFLRNMKSLKTINKISAADFWKEYDAKKKAKDKKK